MLKRVRPCKFVRENNQSCGWESLKGEEFCVLHSQSEKAIKARHARRNRKALDTKDRLEKLKQRARRVEGDPQGSEMEKSKLLLQLYNKIDEYEAELKLKKKPEKIEEEKEGMDGPLMKV